MVIFWGGGCIYVWLDSGVWVWSVVVCVIGGGFGSWVFLLCLWGERVYVLLTTLAERRRGKGGNWKEWWMEGWRDCIYPWGCSGFVYKPVSCVVD